MVASGLACPSCQGAVRPGARFCTSCGSSLARSCPRCGTASEPGDAFCGGCGEFLSQVPARHVNAVADIPDASDPTIAALEAELAEKQLHLQELTGELRAFRAEYLRRVGVLYAELDELRARIADRARAKDPENQEARETASEAHEQARRSREQASESVESPAAPKPEASADLKRLYREVARTVHPDLASSETDRERRDAWMRRANQAFDDRDPDALRAILAEAAAGSREAPPTTGPDRESQLRAAITATTAEIAALEASDLNILRLRVKLERDDGTDPDLLATIAARIAGEIAEADASLYRVAHG